jgi:hypothetical protein
MTASLSVRGGQACLSGCTSRIVRCWLSISDGDHHRTLGANLFCFAQISKPSKCASLSCGSPVLSHGTLLYRTRTEVWMGRATCRAGDLSPMHTKTGSPLRLLALPAVTSIRPVAPGHHPGQRPLDVRRHAQADKYRSPSCSARDAGARLTWGHPFLGPRDRRRLPDSAASRGGVSSVNGVDAHAEGRRFCMPTVKRHLRWPVATYGRRRLACPPGSLGCLRAALGRSSYEDHAHDIRNPAHRSGAAAGGVSGAATGRREGGQVAGVQKEV